MEFKLELIKTFHTWGGYDLGFFNNIVPFENGYIGTSRVGSASR